MTVTILVNNGPGEWRIACLRDDVLIDYAVWRPSELDGVGDIYRGRIASIAPGLAGAFVSLPVAGQLPLIGFLPDSAGAAGRAEGEAVIVAVSRGAQGGKGPRLTAKLKDAQRESEKNAGDGLLARGPTPLQSLLDRYPGASLAADDFALIAELHAAGLPVAKKPVLFDSILEDEIDALSRPDVILGSGARFNITPTPALVAIDIDAGSQAAEGGDAQKLHWRANQQIIPDVARHIMLRNLSGAILIDFAGLSPKKRQGLRETLEQALAEDPLSPRLVGFTGLGLAEIVRPRIRPPLHEVISTPLGCAIAALRHAMAGAEPIGELTIRLPQPLADALAQAPEALAFCAQKRGYPVALAPGSGAL